MKTNINISHTLEGCPTWALSRVYQAGSSQTNCKTMAWLHWAENSKSEPGSARAERIWDIRVKFGSGLEKSRISKLGWAWARKEMEFPSWAQLDIFGPMLSHVDPDWTSLTHVIPLWAVLNSFYTFLQMCTHVRVYQDGLGLSRLEQKSLIWAGLAWAQNKWYIWAELGLGRKWDFQAGLRSGLYKNQGLSWICARLGLNLTLIGLIHPDPNLFIYQAREQSLHFWKSNWDGNFTI